MEKRNTNEPTKWEKYAKGKKPSMKRRCNLNDYLDRGIYMITIAIEGRKPILGKLAGNPDIKEGEDAPHVILSPMGEAVRDCWMAIPRFHPQIEMMRLCIMPDHIHGILFVHERMEKHLGHVINGFKIGTRKAARELGIISSAMPKPTGQQDVCTYNRVQYTVVSPQSQNNHHGKL